ncbi:aminotransferase class I/II-fold pyridoxal phosphate-dependent enzyme [Nocardia donostiensis]|uniref:8-amino-7-oxononanoate synthase n=1 Tax=Nocardia donostiensis TaxID=1538463 RepID=A0A1V2TGR6_9NOCA|nr:aminotransferase class I/II-fold pyridoxal phosphate-dependent enzyme [Nocardia donostiensis]ONM48674.1 2-amino-3-ketobutyrate CoA ligase [Nocardia donostiensis]OQS16863.1 2-amino-3-ketobutyrate CoA ligase [Nocardia donostiensis]OQS17004.1 2-amino-3-ketobutyrate CoA ligase [Nocardia donostiensis]
MTDERDIARRLLAGASGRGADATLSTSPRTPPIPAARPMARATRASARRGPGRQFADHPAVVAALEKQAAIQRLVDDTGLPHPLFLSPEGHNGALISSGGRKLVNYSSYNYLELAGHPRVIGAANDAAERYGTSASATRIVTGEIPLYRELEERLAGIYHAGAALVTSSGFLTNAAVIGFLLSAGDVAICDSLAHASLVAGTQWAGCRRVTFRHNDPESLAALLRSCRHQFDRALVVLEGHYSMDGDLGRIAELAEVARTYDCAVLVDEAHALGVLGAGGLGSREHFDLPGDLIDIWAGSLSKAMGSTGGFIAGDADLVAAVKYAAPGMALYTAGPSPSNIAAVLAGLDVIGDEPDRLARLWSNARLFTGRLREHGMDLADSESTPIVPVIVPGEIRAGYAAAAMLQRGYNAGAILSPVVPAGTERLRFFLTSEHTERQLLDTVDELAEVLAVADKIPDLTIGAPGTPTDLGPLPGTDIPR